MIQGKNVLLTVLLAGGFAACTQDTVLIEKTTVSIGPDGGKVKSADGRAELTIDADALAETRELWVLVRRDVQRNGLKSAMYEFGPSGTTFAKPAMLKVDVNTDAELVLAYADPARPIPLHDTAQGQRVVQGRLEHFSMYGCFDPNAPCMSDSDCLQGQTCDPNTATCSTPQNGCLADSDCPANQVCVNGACGTVNTMSCQVDSDCAQGEVCDPMSWACVQTNNNPACMTDSDCQQGEACVNGACTPSNNNGCQTDQDCMGGTCDPQTGTCTNTQPACNGDADCQQGEHCANGACVPQTMSCQIDANCPQGQICDPMSWTCVPGNNNGCQTDQDCMGGTCDPQTGTCSNTQPACNSDTDCNQGERCENGACISQPMSCQIDANCPQGEVCDQMSWTCVPGNNNNGCQTDQDCMGGTCDPQTGICSNTQPACNSDADCNQGESCTNGACTPSNVVYCQLDSDCAQGEVCDQVTWTCVAANMSVPCQSDQDCPNGTCNPQTATCSP